MEAKPDHPGECSGSAQPDKLMIQVVLDPPAEVAWRAYFKELPGSTHPPLDPRVKLRFVGASQILVETPPEILEDLMSSLRFRTQVANQLFETQDIPKHRQIDEEHELRRAQELDRIRSAQERIDTMK